MDYLLGVDDESRVGAIRFANDQGIFQRTMEDGGHLAIGKFPSVQDERAVTRAEVLALRLAQTAGIDTSHARIVPDEFEPAFEHAELAAAKRLLER